VTTPFFHALYIAGKAVRRAEQRAYHYIVREEETYQRANRRGAAQQAYRDWMRTADKCDRAMAQYKDAARARFGCRREQGRYVVPSEYVIRDCLVRIEPGALHRALNAWCQAWAARDDALAIDR